MILHYDEGEIANVWNRSLSRKSADTVARGMTMPRTFKDAVDDSVEVRIADRHDIDELSAMNYEFNGVTVSSQHILNTLATGQEIVAIATVNDSLAGFACGQFYRSFCYDSLSGEITEMYVRAAYRRQGVGSALLVFLERELHKRGVTSVRILTGQDNEAGLGLYVTLGYTRKGETVLAKEL